MTTRPELRTLVKPAAFLPERITDPVTARAVLRRDGAVLVSGYEPTPDGAVRATADLLGARLHRINNVWADVFARIAFAPQELPLGIVTAIVGAPLLLILVRRFHAPTT